MIHKGLAEAVADDLLAVNPADGAGARANRTTTPENPHPDEGESSGRSCKSSRRIGSAALWRLAVASGARRSELLGCTWLGYNAADRRMEISRRVSPTRGGATITPVKTASSNRTVTLDEETVERSLERRCAAQIEEKRLAGSELYEDNDLIFADPTGRPINPQRITEAFGGRRSAAGIRPGRLHDLRHTHASHLLTCAVPVHIVAAQGSAIARRRSPFRSTHMCSRRQMNKLPTSSPAFLPDKRLQLVCRSRSKPRG